MNTYSKTCKSCNDKFEDYKLKRKRSSKKLYGSDRAGNYFSKIYK